jgi:hypothetical protein
MNMKNWIRVLFLGIVPALVSNGLAELNRGRVETISATAIPLTIRNYLNKTYPGWRLSAKTTGCNKSFERAVVVGDFDGDSAQDYVVKIITDQTGYIIAFLKRGNDYKAVILESGSQQQIRNQGLSVARTGTKFPEIVNENLGRVTRRLQHDAPIGGTCESSTYFYIWRSGSFKRAFVSD